MLSIYVPFRRFQQLRHFNMAVPVLVNCIDRARKMDGGHNIF